MHQAEFFLTLPDLKPILIQKCQVENTIFNNDIITIKKDDFECEFEVISIYNLIDNGVHTMIYSLTPLNKEETK
jgi:hypothetical protein